MRALPVLVLLSVAQSSLPSAGLAQSLTAVTSLPAQGYVARNATITIELSRSLDPTREHVVVFIGTTDVTALVTTDGDRLRYESSLLPLPPGEREVVIHHVSDGEWRELARAALRVPGRFGIEERSFTPNLDAGLKARLDAAYDPVDARPADRATYHDVEARFGLEAAAVHSGARATSRASVFATNEATATLRFAEKGAEAPRIDLASYLLQWDRAPLSIAVGHVSAGSQRHLQQNFASRGASVGVQSGGRVQASMTTQHGSSTVGWDDLLGIARPDHRMVSGQVGIEALPRPGALRLELSALDGAVLPRSGFNQGAVTDSERSRGVALRAQIEALNRRLRVEAGFARSRFENPADPLLARDTALVEVRPETRNARYLETSLEAVRARHIGRGRTASLRIGLAHERVDPLFRTIGTFARADFLQNRVDLRADVAHANFGVSVQHAENNLDDVPSILKTRTERVSLDAAVPVERTFGVLPGGWAPELRYRLDRTHQFGVALPPAGGFAPGHVPDQMSTTHTTSADWSIRSTTLRYQYSTAMQDNRQPGREQADFRTDGHTVATALRVRSTISVSADGSLLEAHSLERGETDDTRRLGAALAWRPWQESALELRWTTSRVENDVTGSTRDDRGWSAQWSSPVPAFGRYHARALVRYAHTISRHEDPRFGAPTRRSSGFLDAGVTLRFF